MMVHLNLGQHLRSLRKNRGLTLTELAKQSGVSHPYISQVENDKFKPSPEILRKIAEPLGVSYEQLLHYAGYIEGVLLGSSKEINLSNLNSLDRAKRWLTINGKLDPDLKDELEPLLNQDPSFSLTIDNLFEKLEDFVAQRPDWTELIKQGVDAYYLSIFFKLNELSSKREQNFENLQTIMSYLKPLSYNGHEVTEQDRTLIISYLDALFSNR